MEIVPLLLFLRFLQESLFLLFFVFLTCSFDGISLNLDYCLLVLLEHELEVWVTFNLGLHDALDYLFVLFNEDVLDVLVVVKCYCTDLHADGLFEVTRPGVVNTA